MPEINNHVIDCLRLIKIYLKKKRPKNIIEETLKINLEQIGDRSILGTRAIPGIDVMIDPKIKLNYCCPNCREYIPSPEKLDRCFYCNYDLPDSH